MRNQTLIIIDMQQKFNAVNDMKTQAAVVESVMTARLSHIPIILVEYNKHHFGPTLDCIMEAVGDYDKVYCIEKDANDGGRQVEKKLEELGLHGSELLVCGIEIAHCIKETVETLVREFSESISIIKRACYCSLLSSGDWLNKEDVFDNQSIYHHENVEII